MQREYFGSSPPVQYGGIMIVIVVDVYGGYSASNSAIGTCLSILPSNWAEECACIA
jgi:hypothetical protein